MRLHERFGISEAGSATLPEPVAATAGRHRRDDGHPAAPIAAGAGARIAGTVIHRG
jgi:hypothetical protein